MKFGCLILLLIIEGCSSGSLKTTSSSVDTLSKANFPVKPLHILTDEEEGGGADIRLSITEIIHFADFTVYKAVSSYKDIDLGLEIDLPKEKKAGTQLIIRKYGHLSTNLLNTLSNLYGLKADPSTEFIDSAKVAYIDLDEFAKKEFGKYPEGRNDTTELKIFFEGDNQNDYAELYLNISDKDQFVEILEKDQGYRKQVIKFLSKNLKK